MAFIYLNTLIILLLLNQSPFPTSSAASNPPDLETYIVMVEKPETEPLITQPGSLREWYNTFLQTATASEEAQQADETRITYSYRNVFKGFSAKLSREEAKSMEAKPGFVFARPEKTLTLHTTHSPDFIGLSPNAGLWKDSNFGKGVIIGLLDTGIFPEHPSFGDESMPPPPERWRGRCEFNRSTACNNKIIGARVFGQGAASPLDEDGHGTHTASTAGGGFVEGASVYGNAKGTASGIAPMAHLAIYRVCSPLCSESNILAAMDAAIEDGVDVLSLSLGYLTNNFFQDFIALGAFSAMEKGIFVTCSAGNNGPLNYSLSNEAPWILTVGASTVDRRLAASAVLGTGERFEGETAFQPAGFESKPVLSLVYAGALNASSDSFVRYCDDLSNATDRVRGSIVVCEPGLVPRIDKGRAVKAAGGAGMILVNPEIYANTTFAEAHVLPAAHVTYAGGARIKEYINSTSNPTATIVFRGTVIGDERAPVVAAYSSRGPNYASRGILKPDILGPGNNILAAWPTSVENVTGAKGTFNVLSGTSMSCPHLSGVAALIKSVHPDWSPAAIKSAIMTTADAVDAAGDPIRDERFVPAGLFATGSGHVNPNRARDPGLVYDVGPEDYVAYLCGLNYTNREVGIFLQRRVRCGSSGIPEGQLNYPSFALTFGARRQAYTRTVTNVGEPESSYTVEVLEPPGVEVRVEPEKLEFSEKNQKLQYMVTFSRRSAAPPANGTVAVVQGYLKWSSDKYSVRSPIAVILQ